MPLNKFIATARFLTVFPLPGTDLQTPPQLTFMPAVGLALGLILFACALLFSTAQPQLAALVITILWLASTGLLHLDGLADLVDGLAASHRDKARLLEVMKEPHIGSFAVITLIIVILSRFVLLSLLFNEQTFAALLLIPAWSRLGAAWWAKSLPALSDGLGAWVKHSRSDALSAWSVLLMLLSLILAPALLLAPLLLWAWKGYLQQKLGGMNGDCLGAGIEVCEVGLLFLCCVNL